jgi:hypothetical protein
MPTLTSTQAEALTWLETCHTASPEWESGFNPESKAHARACRHTLEPMGLVTINRISTLHFRYGLTDAGRGALSAYRKLREEVSGRRAARAAASD